MSARRAVRSDQESEFRSPLVPFLTLYGSPAGFHWIFKGFTDNASSDDNEVIVAGSGLAGTVVAREGQPSPVESISAVDMSGGGDWFAVGGLVNGDRWAVRNGAVIAATGEPIAVAAGSEHYGDAILDADGNTAGDYFVIATTDNPDAGANEVVVLNGVIIMARSGDPVDLDGNGLADDDAFIDAFTANDSFLTDDLNDDLVDDRAVYTFGQLRDGAGAAMGDAFFVVRLPADTCPWDLDRDGIVGVTDLLAVLAAWGTAPGGPPDFDLDGSVGVTDLLKLLALWGGCPL